MAKKKTTGEDNGPLLATVPEVCDYLRLSRATVYRMITAQKLKAIRITDNTIRLSWAEVKKLVADQMPNVAS